MTYINPTNDHVMLDVTRPDGRHETVDLTEWFGWDLPELRVSFRQECPPHVA